MGHQFDTFGRSHLAINCVRCPLQRGKGGDCIWSPETGEASKAGGEIKLAPDEVLLEGVCNTHCYWIVKSGLLRVVHYGVEGRRHLLSFVLPGEVAGFIMPMASVQIIEAASSAVLCKIDKRQFMQRMAVDTAFRHAVYRQEKEQLDRLRWLIWAIGGLSPVERLAAFLIWAMRFMPYEPQEDGSAILTLQVSRSDLADFLNTTAETISRVTHRMQDDGRIEILDAARFRILDLKAIFYMGCVSPDPNAPSEGMPSLVHAKTGGAPRLQAPT